MSGCNNPRWKSRFTCIYCKQECVGHPKRLACDAPACQAKLAEYKRQQKLKNYGQEYRLYKRGKAMNTTNPCIVCGMDKGPNRWYCPACHRIITDSHCPL